MDDEIRPVAGIDYPRTFQEFELWFAGEKSCRDYLVQLRWPEGFQCPRCGLKGEPWVTARGYLHCQKCEAEISVTAGTLFERTRRPLRDWLLAIWFVTSQKNGVSALGLQRVLGLGSYQTAWTWMHKMRRAMVRPGRDKLGEAVEVDETYVGGREEDVHGRETEDKAIVVIAAEILGKKTGRIRLRRVEDLSGDSLIAFVQEVVEHGSLVQTDGWPGYIGLEGHGYRHSVKNIKRSGAYAHEVLPHTHRVASLLKRWLAGTHQGGVQTRRLEYYLDEFTFRFNRRTSRSRGLLFYRLMQQAVAVSPVPYRDLVSGTESVDHKI